MIHSLDETFDGGMRLPHYVNGRLLSAEDLGADQRADQQRFVEMAKAVGAGVVHGLMVESKGPRKLAITPGMGINPNGNTVRLTGTGFTISLTLDQEDSTEHDGARFAACNTGASTRDIVECGAYLLTATPISRPEGSTPLHNSTRCAHQWQREGVKFRAIRLKEFEKAYFKNIFKVCYELLDEGVLGNLGMDVPFIEPGEVGAPFLDASSEGEDGTEVPIRHLLAHWCFGTEPLKRLPRAPFDFPRHYDPLSELEERTPCDLPLAVFFWTDHGLLFVDSWSVRRQITPSQPARHMSCLTSPHREAQGHARWRQFQVHLADIVKRPDFNAKEDKVSFRFLPPAGLVPMVPPSRAVGRVCRELVQEIKSSDADLSDEELSQAAKELTDLVEGDLKDKTNLFRMDQFFSETVKKAYFMDQEPIARRLQESWYEQAIDLRYNPFISVYFSRRSILLLVSYIFLTQFNKLSENIFRAINPKLFAGESASTESTGTEPPGESLPFTPMISHQPRFRFRNDFLRIIPPGQLRLYLPLGTEQQRNLVFPVLSRALQMSRDQVEATLREDTYDGLYCLFTQAEQIEPLDI